MTTLGRDDPIRVMAALRTQNLNRKCPHMVVIYDRKECDPSFREVGGLRFSVRVFSRAAGTQFHSLGEGSGAATLEEARELVPRSGHYFDRTGNWPSPMVPLEGWYFAELPTLRERRGA